MIPNKNYSMLKESYLFSEIAHRVASFTAANPDKSIIKMGIGDVTLPLCEAVCDAMKRAVDEMGQSESFRGYGPEQGYDFLRTKIMAYYNERNIGLSLEEIFISDGAKSDLGNILDILDKQNCVLIPDPVYPVYVDTNIMDGRKIIFADATEENGFLPLPPKDVKADIIYLCSPNNPTGAVYDREQLGMWVDYANENNALILFDAAYEAFVAHEKLPRSIYEIPGADTCAIEFCSLSKTAGFTGTRCGYTIVPDKLQFHGLFLNRLWLRRQTTKFNGVSYIVQRGAEAVFTQEGRAQIQKNIAYYKENARVIMETLDELGIWYTGGKNSPYIWMRCPNGMGSWEFFDYLLNNAGIVGTPGAGFGKNGDGFFRLTAFSSHNSTLEAMERFAAACKKNVIISE